MSAIYMLDTDASSYIIRNTAPILIDAVAAHLHDVICISAITLMELRSGLLNKYSDRLRDRINEYLQHVSVVSWTERDAIIAANIKHHLKKNGTPIGNMDVLIAASAISIGAELVTNNRKHFGLVPGLAIADWI